MQPNRKHYSKHAHTKQNDVVMHVHDMKCIDKSVSQSSSSTNSKSAINSLRSLQKNICMPSVNVYALQHRIMQNAILLLSTLQNKLVHNSVSMQYSMPIHDRAMRNALKWNVVPQHRMH